MSAGKGLRAVARWVMSKGLLGQSSLAKEQSDWVKGREKEVRAKMRVRALIAATMNKPRSKNETELLARQSADNNRGGKGKKESYTPVRDVASAATKQREKKGQSGFFRRTVAVFLPNTIEHLA